MSVKSHTEHLNMIKTNAKVFCDASVSPQANLGVGVYLIVDSHLEKEIQIQFESGGSLRSLVERNCQSVCLKSKESTRMELATCLEALNHLPPSTKSMLIHCDCAAIDRIYGLKGHQLHANAFRSKSGKELSLRKEYEALYKFTATHKVQVQLIKGHAKKSLRLSWQELLFSEIDHLARRLLRENLANL